MSIESKLSFVSHGSCEFVWIRSSFRMYSERFKQHAAIMLGAEKSVTLIFYFATSDLPFCQSICSCALKIQEMS